MAYAGIEGQRRPHLHGDAAAAIEATCGVDLDQFAGALGHHHARAGDSARAALYFERAGNVARRAYATENAIQFYRLALSQVEGAAGHDDLRGQLNEGLGELLVFGGGANEAAEHFRASLASPTADRVRRARRTRKLARALERVDPDASVASYAKAEIELGETAGFAGRAEWYELVQTQVDLAWCLYFLARLGDLDRLLVRARPFVERHGDSAQRFRFFTSMAQGRAKRARFRIDDEALSFTALALRAGEESRDLRERAVAEFAHAFPLMLAGRAAEAEPLFLRAIAGAERVGDNTLLTRVLAYYSLLKRRQEELEPCVSLAERALTLAAATKMQDYLGIAHANLGWASLRSTDHAEALRRETLACEAWAKLPAAYVFPLQWIARLPLAASLFAQGDHDRAIEQLKPLLSASQHLLHDDVMSALGCCVTQGAGSDAIEAVLSTSRAHRLL
jgi:tetratricopeptide (TPR) repeat protein